jgi:serine-type anaerobic sulfatase-maturating enzyme
MLDLIVPPQQQEFGQAKLDTPPRCRRECDVRFACHGGCPKDRVTTTPDDEPGLHDLCPSYETLCTCLASHRSSW